VKDWTKTEYGTPRSWNEIQREKREEQLAKNSSSPMWALPGVLAFGTLSLGCVLHH